MGDCNQACTRMCCLGESFFRLNLINSTGGNKSLALTPLFPARIIPVPMQNFPNGLYVARRTFLGAFGTNWTVSIAMVNSFATGAFGGQGFFMNLIRSDQWAFLAAGGTVLEKRLQPGEVMLCDPSAVVAFEPQVCGYYFSPPTRPRLGQMIQKKD